MPGPAKQKEQETRCEITAGKHKHMEEFHLSTGLQPSKMKAYFAATAGRGRDAKPHLIQTNNQKCSKMLSCTHAPHHSSNNIGNVRVDQHAETTGRPYIEAQVYPANTDRRQLRTNQEHLLIRFDLSQSPRRHHRRLVIQVPVEKPVVLHRTCQRSETAYTKQCRKRHRESQLDPNVR